jgi:membrane protein implicated in regulation of membrane protease activity
MPWGSWINDLPTAFFMVVHIAAFALGAGFAWLAFKRELTVLGTAFSLFAVAELGGFSAPRWTRRPALRSASCPTSA